MSKRLRLFLIIGGATISSVGAIIAIAYWACQQGPIFYEQALDNNESGAKQRSDALLHEAALLANNLRHPGQWHALFTTDQINGWLAYDVLQNHPHIFPPTISDPRVSIENDRTKIAFVWHKLGWNAIVSLETEIYLRETNVIAIRICKARAGLLPLPLAGLLADLISSARTVGLQIDAEQVEDDPLLIVTMPWTENTAGKLLPSLESLEAKEGEIYLAGRCQNAGGAVSVAQRPINSELGSRDSLERHPSNQQLLERQEHVQTSSEQQPDSPAQSESSNEAQTEKLNIHR